MSVQPHDEDMLKSVSVPKNSQAWIGWNARQAEVDQLNTELSRLRNTAVSAIDLQHENAILRAKLAQATHCDEYVAKLSAKGAELAKLTCELIYEKLDLLEKLKNSGKVV